MEINQTITWDQVLLWISDPLNAGIVGAIALLYVTGFSSIFSRAGFHWALGTLMLVPGVNVVLFLLLAFGGWPTYRELRSLRKLEFAVAKAERRHTRAA